MKWDLEEDLKEEGFEFSDIIFQVQATVDKFERKFVDLQDQDVPNQSQNVAGAPATQSAATAASSVSQPPPLVSSSQVRFGLATEFISVQGTDFDRSCLIL